MAKVPAEEKPTPASIAAYVKANAALARKAQQMRHEESVVTRETDYKGHHIVVRTTYEVEVDGKPLMGHMGVTDSGAVHYHPVPNLGFASALDMVRKIIDVFPDDFEAGAMPDSMPMPGMSHASSADSADSAPKAVANKGVAKKPSAKSADSKKKGRG